VRDKPELEIFECASCGLVFLSSFDHIRDGFYESSEMHGEEMPDVQTWLKETAWDYHVLNRGNERQEVSFPQKSSFPLHCLTIGLYMWMNL